MLNEDQKSLSGNIAGSIREYLDRAAKEAEAQGLDAEKITEAVRQAADDLRLLVDCPEQCQLKYQKCIADGGDPDECLEQKITCMSEC